VGNTFGEGFFWTEIVDAAADVYNGVWLLELESDIWSIS
jgi:hypothetical protein